MSDLSNPKAGAADATARYVAAVLEVLGDRDPLTVLRGTAARLRKTAEGVPPAVLRRPERHGQWCGIEVIQHLADSELVWAWRMRLVVAEDSPPLTGYDQDAWARRLRYRDADPADAIEQFEMLRRMNLSLLDGLAPDTMDRVGMHSERGAESLAHMLRLYAGHDLVHLRQLDRVLAAVS